MIRSYTHNLQYKCKNFIDFIPWGLLFEYCKSMIVLNFTGTRKKETDIEGHMNTKADTVKIKSNINQDSQTSS